MGVNGEASNFSLRLHLRIPISRALWSVDQTLYQSMGSTSFLFPEEKYTLGRFKWEALAFYCFQEASFVYSL
jgi:hypothetical protein